MEQTTFVHDVLSRVAAFAQTKNLSLYVVGGVIRDHLLGRAKACVNVDLAIPAKALETARILATQLGGAYVCLDEVVGTARVVISSEQERLELDFSDFRAPTLEGDLALRDFTINAMAVPLGIWRAGPQWVERVIDPLGGRNDLAAGRLRPCFPQTFREDPVRILRAFRFVTELGVSLESSMTSGMRDAVSQLHRIAGERIRDELFAILSTDRASWAMAQLNELGALDVLFPALAHGRGMGQGGYHHLDVLGHQLETVAQCDRMMTDFSEFSPALRPRLAEYVAVQMVERRSRRALVKFAGLFHDVGKPATRRITEDGEIWFLGHEHFGAALMEAVVERVRLSNREAEMMTHLVASHLRPGHLSREPQLTRRAIFRFFRDLGEDGPACLLLWWADRMATRGPSSRLDQIDQQRARLEELLNAYFFRAEEVIRPPRLVDGYELMTALQLKPGPIVGRLLQAIEEAQAEGRLHSKEDAIVFARQVLKTSISDQ